MLTLYTHMNQPKEICSGDRFIEIPYNTVHAHEAPIIDLIFPLFYT